MSRLLAKLSFLPRPRSVHHRIHSAYLQTIFLTIVIFVFIYVGFNHWIGVTRQNILQNERSQLIRIVTIARNTIDPLVLQVRSGELTPAEGQRQITDLVRRMTFNDDQGLNYVFMSSYEGIMLVQPFEPQLEGSNQLQLRDVSGRFIIQELIRTAQEQPQGGFVTYLYYPPNSSTPQEKISYVIGIPELNAYIGAGMYLPRLFLSQQAVFAEARYLALGIVLLMSVASLFSLSRISERNRAVNREAHERKLAEEALAASEHNLRTVFDSSYDAVFIHDRLGRIVEVNERVLTLYGVDRPTILQMNVADISAPHEIESQHAGQLWAMLQPGQDRVVEWKVRKVSTGELFDVEVALRPILWYGQERILAVVREITERVRAQKQIQTDLEKLDGLRAVDTCIMNHEKIQVTLGVIAQQALRHLDIDSVKILLTGEDLPPVHILGGAAWGVPQPGQVVQVPISVHGQEQGQLVVRLPGSTRPNQEWHEYLETLANRAAIALDNNRLFTHLNRTNQELTEAYEALINGWSRALELRDKETRGHSERVLTLATELAQRAGYPAAQMPDFRRGVLLHDIGKMGIPDSILLKPGPLNEDEWRLMRQHPQMALHLLQEVRYLRPALDIPYAHHERWDGSGYPNGLQGEAIPLAARIFALVDVWDALISDRPYRAGWPVDKVIQYLRENAGVQFDPYLTQVFLDLLESC